MKIEHLINLTIQWSSHRALMHDSSKNPSWEMLPKSKNVIQKPKSKKWRHEWMYWSLPLSHSAWITLCLFNIILFLDIFKSSGCFNLVVLCSSISSINESLLWGIHFALYSLQWKFSGFSAVLKSLAIFWNGCILHLQSHSFLLCHFQCR